jgi:hypothetical protein
LGAGGHGKVVADTALAFEWSEVHFFDDAYVGKQDLCCWKVVGTFTDLLSRVAEFDDVVVGIGGNRMRWRKYSELN